MNQIQPTMELMFYGIVFGFESKLKISSLKEVVFGNPVDFLCWKFGFMLLIFYQINECVSECK